jgi:PiT family inorganic phosphate transporter
MTASEIDEMGVTKAAIAMLRTDWFTSEQKKALEQLEGREFVHKWQLNEALAEISPQWRLRANDKSYNKNLRNKLAHIYRFFRYEIDY